MKYWLLLAGAIVAEVVGTSALKASESFTKLWPSFLVVAGYATAFYLLSHTLKAIPVGIAYAVWSGLGVVLITLAGWALFGQRPDGPAVLGMAFIVVGIVIMNVFSRTVSF